MTNREVISRIRVGLKLTTLDDRIPSKFIYNTMVDVFQLIIKREAESRKLFNSTELFTLLECVEMTNASDKRCSGLLIPCKNLSRTIKKLPTPLLSSNGSIVFVQTLSDENGGETIYQTTPSKYQQISKREFKSNIKYFWINDGYLYIPNSMIKFINIYMIPESLKEVDQFNNELCTPFLDSKSSIPQYWMEEIVRSTIEKLANSYKRFVTDENSNLNENIKN